MALDNKELSKAEELYNELSIKKFGKVVEKLDKAKAIKFAEAYADQEVKGKIILELNTDDPFGNYLENKRGDKFYFDPYKSNGEELDNFLSGLTN